MANAAFPNSFKVAPIANYFKLKYLTLKLFFGRHPLLPPATAACIMALD
jgi:hypothetical protein